MDENRQKPFQFSLRSLMAVMVAVSVATSLSVLYPTLGLLFLMALAFFAWINILLGLAGALVWTGERLWRLFKKRDTNRRGVA